MADNINIAPTGSTPIATDDVGGVHYQKVKLVNGDDGVDGGTTSTTNPLVVQEAGWITKALMKVFGRFSFDSVSALRTSTAVTSLPTLPTVTTVGTVTTGNIGFGDAGKASTIQQNSANVFGNTNSRNFVRS